MTHDYKRNGTTTLLAALNTANREIYGLCQHVRFTLTSASWLNMVERFFRDFTQNGLRRGVFQDLEQPIIAIGDYIDGHSKNPKPFLWTAKANDILEKVTRAQTALNKRRST